jgi:chromate transporter
LRQHWWEVSEAFLKIGGLSYGGPATMGIIQAEVQEKRAWLPKAQFLEGLALVHTLPGPGGIQLAIFLGYSRAGWWGGLLAGLCFLLPAFGLLLTLSVLYTHYGALPHMRQVFYGLSPVVVALFAMSVYRLGRAAVHDVPQLLLAGAAVLVVGLTPMGIVPTLLVSGAAGVALYGSRPWGITAALLILGLYAAQQWGTVWLLSPAGTGTGMSQTGSPLSPDLWDIGRFFFKVGAFSFGGGLTILAFIQEQVVEQLHWLTPQQFLDGLALGRLTPGPTLMLAAFVGYAVSAIWGAAVAAAAVYLPSFILMLSVLPWLAFLKRLVWVQAALQGVSPAVIGVTVVALLWMLPAAIPDVFAGVLALGTVVALARWRLSPLPLMAAGAVLGLAFHAR